MNSISPIRSQPSLTVYSRVHTPLKLFNTITPVVFHSSHEKGNLHRLNNFKIFLF